MNLDFEFCAEVDPTLPLPHCLEEELDKDRLDEIINDELPKEEVDNRFTAQDKEEKVFGWAP